MVEQGMGDVGWVGEHTLTHNPSYGCSGTSREEAEDVVVVVAGPGRVGNQLGGGTGKWQADGWSGTGGRSGEGEVENRQTTTGTGGQES